MTASAGTRQLRRNISNTSSAANNFGAAAALAVASSEQQAWPCSTLSPTAVLQREIQPSLQVLQAVQPVPQTDQLLLGTSAGLFLLDLQTQSLQLLGLQDTQAEAREQQHQQGVLVGVEVGGALAHTPGSPSSSSSDSDSLSSAAWDDCSQGLCRDVQALQADPFTPSKLYAVAGSGSLPGGLYRCRGKGQKWRRLFGYRYSVGMAVSPYSKGRLMLVSADKPPEIGCSLFESVDGGRHFVNVTDYIAEATASITEYAPGLLEHCPVVTYVPGGLVLGCVTGHVLMGTALPGGGFSSWQLLAKLPTAVHSMCMTQDGATPASIQRA
ncbi:hypothetical protein OEZ85_004998 [Tetradesmus obliquus]|uniref:Uncharacterized protein n=1 Tax=Tetradesmus obliquus TaxID=3088 RepID=A0ABY8UHL2_TETOB|nr:hypothetical protein OEZ85_004998 [Tetradesmus obliquus]